MKASELQMGDTVVCEGGWVQLLSHPEAHDGMGNPIPHGRLSFLGLDEKGRELINHIHPDMEVTLYHE